MRLPTSSLSGIALGKKILNQHQHQLHCMSNGQSQQQVGIRPIVFSGPSGSGKSTLIQKLFVKHPDSFQFSVSHTTRQPRVGEEHGKHYWFVTAEEMQKMIDSNEFLEHTKFAANSYGTSKSAVQQVISTGRIPLLDVDVRGVRSLKSAGLQPMPLFVYIRAPSIEALRQRLIARNTDSEEKITLRLAEAAEGDAYAEEEGAYDAVIINDDLEIAFQQLHRFLIPEVERAAAAK